MYAITGAHGYVGSIIAAALGGSGSVTGLGRQPRSAQDIEWSFTSPRDLAPDLQARGIKVLVHCAWDMQASSAQEIENICVHGSRRLFEAADKAAVDRIVFISTISAFAGCRSVYGQKKLAVEDMVRARGGTVLRLGLVFGPNAGGAFGNLYNQIGRSAFVPVINAGREPQYLLSSRTLSDTARRAAGGDFDGLHGNPLTLAHPHPWSFRDIVQKLAEIKKCKARIVPVPWWFLYGGLRSAESLGLKLPFRSDSVISIVYANPTPDFSPMTTYDIQPIAFPNGLAT